MALADEQIMEIFSYLPPKDKISASLSIKKFRDFAINNKDVLFDPVIDNAASTIGQTEINNLSKYTNLSKIQRAALVAVARPNVETFQGTFCGEISKTSTQNLIQTTMGPIMFTALFQTFFGTSTINMDNECLFILAEYFQGYLLRYIGNVYFMLLKISNEETHEEGKWSTYPTLGVSTFCLFQEIQHYQQTSMALEYDFFNHQTDDSAVTTWDGRLSSVDQVVVAKTIHRLLSRAGVMKFNFSAIRHLWSEMFRLALVFSDVYGRCHCQPESPQVTQPTTASVLSEIAHIPGKTLTLGKAEICWTAERVGLGKKNNPV